MEVDVVVGELGLLVSGPSRGMMVELEKQAHLQKVVGAVDG